MGKIKINTISGNIKINEVLEKYEEYKIGSKAED